MLIVDEENIYNIDNIIRIYVVGEFIMYDNREVNREVIGQYENEDRARDVLTEIYLAYNEGSRIFILPKE